MTRPVERIQIVLDILRDAWLQNPDLRLTQLILNCWVSYHTEDTDLCKAVWDTYWVESVYWGTRGKNWDQPLQYKRLSELSSDHIRAIIKTQFQISSDLRWVLVDELFKRKQYEQESDI